VGFCRWCYDASLRTDAESVPSMLIVIIKSYQGERALDPGSKYWLLMPKRTTQST
jgi:hypothetical protein